MADVLIFDKITGKGLSYMTSVNTPDYEGRDDVIINPDKNLAAVPPDYIKIEGSTPSEMSVAEKEAVDAAKPVAKLTSLMILQKQIDDAIRNLDAINKNYPDIEALFHTRPETLDSQGR